MLVSAAGHTAPKYGQRHHDTSRGSTNRRTVDLQPYRRLYGAMLLQQVSTVVSSPTVCLCETRQDKTRRASSETSGWSKQAAGRN